MKQPMTPETPVERPGRSLSGKTTVSTRQGILQSAGRGWVVPMDKWLCWASMGGAGLLLLLFVLDITPLALPFGGISVVVDIIGILASGLVLYLAWDASRELR